MQAIRTKYKGILFRSKLEAEWAKFMDSMGMRWIYEPEGFKFSDGTKYLPDFWLPDSKQWFEVKGIMSVKDEHKIEMLKRESGHPVIIGYSDGAFEAEDRWDDEDGKPIYTKASKEHSVINRCIVCGRLSYMGVSGSYECSCCGAHDGDHYCSWVMYGDNDGVEWRERAKIDVIRANQNTYPESQILHDFWKTIENDDRSKGGTFNFCDYDYIQAAWNTFVADVKSDAGYEISIRCPKQKTSDHFRDIRIEKIFRWKAQGAEPMDLIRAGVSSAMVYKYWNNKPLAERVVKHKL